MTGRNAGGHIFVALAVVIAVAVVGTEMARSTTVGPSAATGLIVAVPGSNLLDGETFTIDDGAGGTTTFEFDSKNASGVTLGHEAIPFAGSDSASQVADQIRDAVSGAAQLQVSANSTGPAVWLVNDNVGSAGNVPITEAVSDVDFLVLGMSGGTNDTAPSGGTVNDGLSGDVDRQGDASVLEANWSGFTDDVGVDHYEYSASTSATCSGDVVSATNVGTATSYTAAASLNMGTTYHSCVRAYDASGNPSAWVASDGVELASGTLTVTSAVKAKGTIMVTFTDSANTPWIAQSDAATPFECNLGPRGAWVPCASGDTFKSSAKSVTVRGYLDVDPPLLVQSSPYTPTR